MTASRNITTPSGRLVGGSLFQGRDKDFDGRPLKTRDGKERIDYVIQVAFDKREEAVQALMQQIYAVGQESFPTLFVNGQPPRDFSFKITDGDSHEPNQRGGIPANREGFPGHWVLTFKSSFPPKVYDRDLVPIVDEKAVKVGDYVRVNVNIRGNSTQSNPGVYLNHGMVQVVGYGAEIITGPDASAAFAETAALPAGASATPTAPSTPLPGTAPGAPPVPPVPGTAPAPMPFNIPGAGAAAPPAPAPPAPPAPPAAPPAKTTLPGCPYTYEQLAGQGWTDDQMRAAGYLA